MNPVRVYLALLLAVQFLVPLMPSWGAIVPHDHWARTRITPADWSAHLREHQRGEIQTPRPTSSPAVTQIVSVPAYDGLTSYQTPLASHDANLEFVLTSRVMLHTVLAHEFTARIVTYPPLNPPPTI